MGIRSLLSPATFVYFYAFFFHLTVWLQTSVVTQTQKNPTALCIRPSQVTLHTGLIPLDTVQTSQAQFAPTYDDPSIALDRVWAG